MSLHVLIVPDKFKGTLTARDAADLIARGWRETRPQDTLEQLPMSDGGDGFGEVFGGLLGMEEKTVATLDAAHGPIQARWWWEPGARLAVVESAKIIGLALQPAGKHRPYALDTYGLGAVLQEAVDAGARRCLVGIGGSATNDGGFGLARSLGWSFLDEDGRPIEQWSQLNLLQRICSPPSPQKWPELVVAVDVQNPLLGEKGATRVYGPQKGLTTEDFEHAEKCLARLAEVVRTDLKLDAASDPGGGAAGGLGFGLRCFFGARLESGFELFAHYSRLSDRVRTAQWVVTGEGAIDPSTFMGKGVGEIAKICRSANVPCIGLAGILRHVDPAAATGCFTRVFGVSPQLTTPEIAMRDAGFWLPRLAAEAARVCLPETSTG